MSNRGYVMGKNGRLLRSRRVKVVAGLAMGWLIWYVFFSLPEPLFEAAYSRVMLDREGRLLGARVAEDEQWRFPPSDSLPERYVTALLAYEDKRFFQHPGVDPLALARAAWLNLRHWRKLSGGSTITMQTIRLARQNQPRTVWEKALEMTLATRLEWRYPKKDILRLYASHAPFGGNVVGLEAAAWKYLGRAATELSWAEAALLAVLPNAPGLLNLSRNRDGLRQKRNWLLNRLRAEGHLDSLGCALAMAEPLPQKPFPLPDLAPHLLQTAQLTGFPTCEPLRTTLSRALQMGTNRILAHQLRPLLANRIRHAAILVADTRTGAVLAYTANAPCAISPSGCYVDMIRAERSTGSILKPLLYAAMLDQGQLLPKQWVVDVPSSFGGYSPKNFYPIYDGVVPADQALARSLNVPAVHLLNQFGVTRFKSVLESLGLRSLHRPAEEYGLSLILGGAEASLWDLCGVYASLGRSVSGVDRPFYPLLITGQQPPQPQRSPISQMSAWHTLEAMAEVGRPEAEAGWKSFASAPKIAWKTGTSFGARDAWAIGCTPNYVVGVWVGNASGEGRPGLSGIEAAAPILFEVWAMLQQQPGGTGGWFAQPSGVQISTCAQTGYLAAAQCPTKQPEWVSNPELPHQPCPYHHVVLLDSTGQYRADSRCHPVSRLRRDTLLVLPPLAEAYYRRRQSGYRLMPPYAPGCRETQSAAMALLYPKAGARLLIPIDLAGQPSDIVCRASHRRPDATIYWHLDKTYLGSTNEQHKMPIRPTPGSHMLTLFDEMGESLRIPIFLLAR